MKNNSKAYFAYLFICIVWGTTYLAIRVGVLHYPPFLFAGIRQLISGIILAGTGLILYKKVDWSLRNLLWQAWVGFLLITVGNGLVTWSEQYVSSGVAALICATMPMSAVLINILVGKERINLLICLGMLLGVGGVAFIFHDNLNQPHSNMFLPGIAALAVATFSWAWGSILNKKRANVQNPIFNSGLQLFSGGLIMLLISPVTDDYSHMALWNRDGLLALAYLVIFGSVLAFAAYMYALKELPVGFVTSYAYVNPLVAVILGYFLLNEPLNKWTLLAFLLIVTGIFIVNKGYKKQRRAEKPAAPLPAE